MRRLDSVLPLLLLLLASPVHALETPPIHLADLTGQVHGGFDRVNQFAVRSDGRVYMSDAYNHRVVVYSPGGVYLEQIGSLGDALGQFDVASGVAFDANDNLFVSSQVSGHITKLSPTHLPLMRFGSNGTGPGQLSGPNNLAVSPDNGHLYVAELLGDRISIFDTDGNYIGSFGETGSGPGQLDHPSDVAVAKNGDVLVADQYNHRIQRFSGTGTYLGEWGGFGTAPGQFNYVVGLTLDEDGNVYATDQLNNRVQKLLPDGTPLAVWGTLGSGPGQMYNPWAVQPLSDGTIWVADTWNHRISIYGPGPIAGGIIEILAEAIPPQPGASEAILPTNFSCGLEPPPAHLRDLTGLVHGGFDRANQLARRADGRIYITDTYHHRVLVYSAEGDYLEQIGSHGTGPGRFDVASGIAFDADGNLFVASQAGNRVSKLSASNLPLMEFGTGGTGPGQIQGPDNLAFSPFNGQIYVAELLGDRVSAFDTEGNFVTSFGGTGTDPGQFDHPAGIVVEANGTVLVADQYNHRVERFSAAGGYLSHWGAFGTDPGQFNYVVGLGLDEAGNVYATDQLNNRVQKLRPDGTPLAIWGSFGHAPGEMYNPWAVLPLPNGEIWVGDTYNYRISIYGPGESTPAPRIDSIVDVPEDDGFQVRIHFLPSSLDAVGSPTPILQYEAFRRIDRAQAQAGAGRGARPAAPDAISSTHEALLAGWEFVGAVPAHVEDEYYMVAPTLVNASRGAMRYSVFFIRAATAVPSTFFDSCPDSGASFDNTPPDAPQGFTADIQQNGDVMLAWQPNQEGDLLDYSLYKGTSAEFAPDASTLIATPADPSYIDAGAAGAGMVFYKLSATDIAGNESEFAVTSLEGLVGVPGTHAPTAFALYPAAPNPMSDRAVFQFDLPIQSVASLRIFDLSGRLVRTLGAGVLEAGRYRWDWNGRDAGGARVPAGVYFYRLQTPVFTRTMRIAIAE